MKNIIILSCIAPLLLFGSIVNAQNDDIFKSIKFFAESSSKKVEFENVVISDGQSMEDVIEQKVTEKYAIAKNNTSNSNDNVSSGNNISSGNNKPNNNSMQKPDKYPNQNSFFAGTTDFTNINASVKDANLNAWSAIRNSYRKFDDGKEDNVTIIATAYTSAAEENGGWAGLNAIGGKLGPGCIAAPKDIPFQTKIRISGLGVFNVEDRGGAIVRVSDDIIRIDVWMDSYKEAMHFGKRVYKGRILK